MGREEIFEAQGLLNSIVERACALLRGRGGGMYLYDRMSDQAVCVVSYNTLKDYKGVRLRPGEGSAGRVIQSGEPLIINDYQNWEGSAEAFEEDRPFTAVISAPLKWEGEVLGVIHVLDDAAGRTFTKADLELLLAFADQAAMTLQNARLYQESRRRAEGLAALHRVSLKLVAQHELPRLLEEIVRSAGELLGANGGGVYLYNREREELELVLSLGLSRDYRGMRLKLGEGSAGKVVQSSEPLIIEDYKSWEGRSPQYAAEPLTSIISVPLRAEDRIVGALNIHTDEEDRIFDEEDLRLATLFADQAAIALENARLYREAGELSEKYRSLVENELVGIYVIQDGIFKYVNRGLCQMFGYREAEVIGRLGPLDLAYPEDHRLVLERLRERLEGEKESAHYTFRGVRKEGEIFDCEVLGRRIDYEGRPAVQGILLDISLVKEAERLRRALLEIAEEILASYDIERILRQVAEAVVKHSPFQRAAVSLYDLTAEEPPDTPVMRIYSAGLTKEEEEQLISQGGLRLEYRRAAFSEEFRLGRSYYVPHDRLPWGKGEGVPGRVSLDGWHADDFLFIPLRTERGIIGHISVDDPRVPRAVDRAVLEPLETFAGLAALAVERAARMAELQRHKEWLRGSYQIGQQLARYRTLKELLNGILGILREEFRYDYGAVLLLQGEELVVEAVESTVAERKIDLGTRISLNQGITGWVAAHGQPALVNDVTQDPRYIMGHEAIRSELAVPLQLGEEFLGVLNVESTAENRFRPEDQEFLTSVAAQLAVAIKEIHEREALKELSIRDPLTGLYNRRYLGEALERELERSRRYGHSLALLMIDLDNFREVNNRHGHLKGDEVLHEVAELLVRNVRATDMVFRYGGDEFLILMPETDSEAQQAPDSVLRGQAPDFVLRGQAIGRLKRAVEEWNEQSGLDCRVGISIGAISWSPGEERGIEEVLAEADRWMYQEKRGE